MFVIEVSVHASFIGMDLLKVKYLLLGCDGFYAMVKGRATLLQEALFHGRDLQI